MGTEEARVRGHGAERPAPPRRLLEAARKFLHDEGWDLVCPERAAYRVRTLAELLAKHEEAARHPLVVGERRSCTCGQAPLWDAACPLCKGKGVFYTVTVQP